MKWDSSNSGHGDRKDRCDLHRREFLQRGVAAAGASTLLAAGKSLANPFPQPSTQDKPPAYIDAHVHIWTGDERYPMPEPNTRKSLNPATALPDDLLKLARPAGVDRIVLIQPGYYGYDNSYMIDTIRRWPTVFRAVAVVDWHAKHPEAQMRKLKKHGVRGFRIYPDPSAGPGFTGEGFQKMFSARRRSG